MVPGTAPGGAGGAQEDFVARRLVRWRVYLKLCSGLALRRACKGREKRRQTLKTRGQVGTPCAQGGSRLSRTHRGAAAAAGTGVGQP